MPDEQDDVQVFRGSKHESLSSGPFVAGRPVNKISSLRRLNSQLAKQHRPGIEFP